MKEETYSQFDLLAVATSLINRNGHTTTLDIKRELRDRGHIAYQQGVSENMIWLTDLLADTFTFEDVENDHLVLHRSYSFVNHTPTSQPTLKDKLFGVFLSGIN